MPLNLRGEISTVPKRFQPDGELMVKAFIEKIHDVLNLSSNKVRKKGQNAN